MHPLVGLLYRQKGYEKLFDRKRCGYTGRSFRLVEKRTDIHLNYLQSAASEKQYFQRWLRASVLRFSVLSSLS